MNPAIAQIDHKSCFKCNFEADTAETRCPQCGRTLKSSKNLRIRGGVLVFLGAFLILFMAGLAAFVAYLVWGGGIPNAASKFKGVDGAKLAIVFGAFGFVMFFGLISLINGIYQLIYARRSQVLVWVMMFLVFVLIIGGTSISLFFK